MRIQAHAYIRLLLHHPGDSGRMTIACIGQHQLAGLKAKTPKPLRLSAPRVSGEIEIIALQRGQPQTVVNPPLAAGLTRFFDHRGVQQSHRFAHQARLQIDSVIFPQLLAQLPQPTLGVPQTI